jgi:capsular exopolysaccharide synthesis family protein
MLGRRRPEPAAVRDAPGQPEAPRWPTLRTITRVLRRRWLIVAVCTLGAAAAALALTLREDKQYESSASLLLRPANVESSVFTSATSKTPDATRVAATNADLAGLDVIARRAARRVTQRHVTGSFVASNVDAFAKQNSDVTTITATTDDPVLSRQIANAFASEYIAFRRDVDRASVRRALVPIERRLAKLTPRQRRTREGRRLRRVAQNLQVLAAIRTGGTELLERGRVSHSAVSPTPKKNLAMGLLFGLMLGVSLAFVREFTDRRLHDEIDVSRAFGLPILASIPKTRNVWKPESRRESRGSLDTEAFGMLRANLRYLGVGKDIRSLLVTSAERGDGKSAVAWNLANAEAKAGKNVLLIEADLRAGRLSERLHSVPGTGLTLLLAGGTSLEESTVTVTSSSGRFDVVPAGPPATNPAELGESPQMALLLESAQMRYDLVIVDTPPVSVVADAVPLMSQVGGVILVARLEQSTSDRAEDLREHLRRLGVRVLGVVVNCARRPR